MKSIQKAIWCVFNIKDIWFSHSWPWKCRQGIMRHACCTLKTKICMCNMGVWFTLIMRWRAKLTQWVMELDYLTTHTSLSPIWHGFAPGFVNYKKGCTRLAAASDKVYQLLAYGRWFSPGTPASSATKTCHLDIAEILWR